jgi:subtilisin family serine protease
VRTRFAISLALLGVAAVGITSPGSALARGHAARPLTLQGPTQVVQGESVRIGPRARLAPSRRPIKSFALTFGDSTRPLRGSSLPRTARHVYSHPGTFTAKLTVVDHLGAHLTARKRILVRAAPPASPRPAPLGPPAPPPLSLAAIGVEVTVGATAPVDLPAPLTVVSGIDSASGAPARVSARVEEGGITVVAGAEALPQNAVLTITGSGCASSECGRQFSLRVPIAVRELAAPPGPLEAFTAASPDRIAEGTPTPAGGVRLRDELVVTFGTPDSPGSREEAEEAAEAFGAAVSGGVEEIGVFEFRWEAPQDLDLIEEELLTWPGVTAVSDSLVGVVGEDAAPPGDWSDDGPQATWPFTTLTRTTQAWDTTHGSNVTVGIVDGGQVFGGHEDLDVTKKLGSNGPGWHATHVAGTACAKANGIGVVGFAWGCPIVTSGWGDRSDKAILAAATAVAKQPGVKVINMSLCYPSDGCASSSIQEQLIEEASGYKAAFRQLFRGPIGRNIVWTISAGNNCAAGVPSPWGLNSDLGNVIAVAAVNSDGKLARFSDFGPGVEVAAPGGVSVSPIGNGTVGVWSTFVNSCYIFFNCQGYAANLPDGQPIAGTSMAAPAVAGIAALVRSAHPDYGASRAAGCITGGAGEGTGTAASRSSLPAGSAPIMAYTPTLPIVDSVAAVACDSLVFNGSPGTGPPPSTLGPYTMTSFGSDTRPLGSVSGVADPAGTIGFSPSLTHLRVPTSWATWSHGYTGDVYFTETESSVEITLPSGTDAFAFYAEPNTFQSFTVEAIAQDGTSSEPVDIEGKSGARYFGFYGTGGKTVASIEISASDPAGFAIGEFQIAR